MTHQYGSEANRSEHNSASNPTTPPRIQTTSEEDAQSSHSTSGEEMASYMLTDISSNASGIQMTVQNEEREMATYSQVRKQPKNPVPAKVSNQINCKN